MVPLCAYRIYEDEQWARANPVQYQKLRGALDARERVLRRTSDSAPTYVAKPLFAEYADVRSGH